MCRVFPTKPAVKKRKVDMVLLFNQIKYINRIAVPERIRI